MKNTDVPHTRTVALVGHAHDGKTSLGEALLHLAGATPTLGRVDDGSSVLNYLPEEKDRHTATISTSFYAFDWQDHHITLADTPGDPNFQGDGLIVLRGMDGVVATVSAVDGPKVGTERMLQAGLDAGAAALAFVNGMDRERADFAGAVSGLKKLGVPAVPVVLPIGWAEGFRGVVDLMGRRAHTAGGVGEVPAELADAVDTARQELVEAVAECDDELLEKYLEEGELGDDEVRRGLVTAVRSRALVPVYAGAATAPLGVDLLLAAIVDLLPSPAERAPWTASSEEGEVALAGDAAATPAALVLKTVIDRYAGTLSVFRVVSGRFQHDEVVLNASTGEKERLGKLFVMRGGDHAEVPEAGPGDVVAVAKLKDTHTGHALTAEKKGVRLPQIPIPQGVLSYAISAKSQGDEDKVHASLGRLVEEDPTLSLDREASTGEFLLTGMGELHIRTTVQRLRRMFEVDVDLKTPKVPYRETITRKAENVEGKLKKQTGGKGMFGVCYLTVEPLARGGGFEFCDEIVGGAIPRGLIPAVEKGVVESMARGPLAGYPVVDVRVRCIDGKHHSVDSNEMAFKLAGAFGFKSAVSQAGATLLEPVVQVEVTVPDDHVGDVMGDISSRRGRVQASESRGTATLVKATVPMAEMLEYSTALTSLTGGKGAFHMEFSHYDEAPAQVREKVVAESRVEAADES